MSFNCLGLQTYLISPQDYEKAVALAIKLSEFGGTVYERREKETRKAYIKGKILSNQMIPFYWIMAHIRSTNERARFNGQHSTDVIIEIAPEEWRQVKTNIPIIWGEYECETAYQAAELFEQFDREMSERKAPDIIGVHVNIHERLRALHLDPTLMAKVTSGMQWFHERCLREPHHEARAGNLIHEPDPRIHDFLEYAGALLNDKTPEMTANPIVGAIYHTTRNGNEHLKQFWRDVSKGSSHLDEGSIAYKLADFLKDYRKKDQIKWPQQVIKRLSGHKPWPSPDDCFMTCLHACDGFMRTQKMGEVFQAAEGRKPDVIIKEVYPFNLIPPAVAA